MHRRLPPALPRTPLWLAGFLLVVGYGGVPSFLKHAFVDGTPSYLQATLAPYPHVGLDFLLGQWYGMIVFGVLACLAYLTLAMLLRSPAVATRLVGHATPGRLGALRVLVCGTLLLNVLWEHLPSSAALPRAMADPMGFLQGLYALPLGFDRLAASPTALGGVQVVTGVVLFCAMIGWRTRAALVASVIAYFIFGGLLRQYAHFYHGGVLPLWLMFVMCFLPTGDGWSVDRLLQRWRGAPVPASARRTAAYGWAVYALWVVMALWYMMAGLSKLRNGGWFWWDAVNFKSILFYSVLRPMEFDFKFTFLLQSAPDVLFEAMALTALLGEVLFGLVLFSRRARLVFPALMAGMHVGILLLQNILFYDLMLLQLVFYNLRTVRLYLARRWAQQGYLRLTYPAQRRFPAAVRVLRSLDLFHRLAFTPEATASAWTLTYQGRVYLGSARYRALLRRLPALWWALPLTVLPGFAAALDRWFYRPPAPSQPVSPSPIFQGSPRIALTAAALIMALWVFRVEFYPLTAVQMFSQKRDHVITYEFAWAYLSSGERRRAPIEAAIPAMSDSRYRHLLKKVFDDNKRSLTEEFFDTVTARWNARAPAHEQIQRIEVEQRRWDFLADPHDPNYGMLVDRRAFTFAPNALR